MSTHPAKARTPPIIGWSTSQVAFMGSTAAWKSLEYRIVTVTGGAAATRSGNTAHTRRTMEISLSLRRDMA
jgi:hypothetical protein